MPAVLLGTILITILNIHVNYYILTRILQCLVRISHF